MPPRTKRLRSGSAPARRKGVRKVNPERRASERLRTYGTPERRTWIASNHCCACGAAPPCENAHVSTGGMGRKADANRIVPLCHRCHEEQHCVGWHAFAEKHGKDWAFFGYLANLYDGAWAHVAASSHGGT